MKIQFEPQTACRDNVGAKKYDTDVTRNDILFQQALSLLLIQQLYETEMLSVPALEQTLWPTDFRYLCCNIRADGIVYRRLPKRYLQDVNDVGIEQF